MNTFNLFVYGTLMQGYRANSFIPKDSKMLKGKIAGNLFHYIAGYPIVEILKHPQSICGTEDYLEDVAKQNNLNKTRLDSLPFDLNYGRVYGELYEIVFSDKEELEDSLNALDSYEGFNPHSDYSLYNRTLVPVETEEGIIWSWVYNMESIPNYTVHILSGNWRDCFNTYGSIRPEVSRAIQFKAMMNKGY